MRLTKFGHSCLLVEDGGARVLLDPGSFSEGFETLEGLTLGGLAVRVIGRDHAAVHPDVPVIPNVGYLVGGRLFHPGDSLTMPGEPVEVLAVPAGAPWLKLADAVDYLRKVGPRVAVPVHEKVLSEVGIGSHYRLLEQLRGPGTAFEVLDDGRPVEL